MKAKRNKTKYKSTENWLNAMYNNNKDFIDSKLENTGNMSKKKQFKNLVKEYMDEGYSPTQAVKKLEKSTIFTPEVDRFNENAWKGLKSDKEAYNTFRQLTKKNGRFTKINREELQYDKDIRGYIYNGVVIKFSNSPYEVIVEML